MYLYLQGLSKLESSKTSQVSNEPIGTKAVTADAKKKCSPSKRLLSKTLKSR